MDFGQRYLQYLSKDSSTGGQLPKVIAAYNAGPAPIARWQTEIRDGGDPLLYIESIPYWETRGYVGIVLRNYWMYEAQQGKPSVSRAALAQGKWPRFPDSKDRVRLTWAGPAGLANAD
jgi:soluble lytic murein transglycosylase-like protein